MMAKITNAQRAEIARYLAASRAPTAEGQVTSYDPVAGACIISIMPDQVPTGWLPILHPMVGNGFGVYAGPSIGDNALIQYVEGDRNVGIVLGFLSSDEDVPPKVESGEIFVQSKFNCSVVMTKDGKLALSSNSDLNITVGGDLNANVTGKTILTCSDVELGASGGKKVVLDGDSVVSGKVVASSTKVKAT